MAIRFVSAVIQGTPTLEGGGFLGLGERQRAAGGEEEGDDGAQSGLHGVSKICCGWSHGSGTLTKRVCRTIRRGSPASQVLAGG